MIAVRTNSVRSFRPFARISKLSEAVKARRRLGNLARAGQAALEALEGRTMMSTVVVNSVSDTAAGTGVITLRDAIDIANSSTAPTTITFSPSVFSKPATITLDEDFLELENTAESTTIIGPAAGVTISGGDETGGFVIDSDVQATLSNLTISDCQSDVGGAIYNEGDLTLTGCTMAGNVATLDDDGAALADLGYSLLVNDTLTDNIGCALNERGGDSEVVNCTITGNNSYAPYSGAGIYIQDGGSVTIGNSIVAGNSSDAGGGADVWGDFNSVGNNLIGETDGGTGWIHSDLTGTTDSPLDPHLGALADNGGPTATILPLPGSYAIGGGSVDSIPDGVTTDQRGLPRTVHGKVDIGAVELQPSLVLTAPAAQTAVVNAPTLFSLGSFTEAQTVYPYTASVNWGDNTNSTLTVSDAGTISGIHTYNAKGSDTVTVSLEDSAGNKSNTITFKVSVTAAKVATITPKAPAAQSATAGTSKSFSLGSFTASNALGPYSVTVNWGDGSANSSFSVSAAGNIPSAAHTYTLSGSHTVTISIKDSPKDATGTTSFAVTVAAAAAKKLAILKQPTTATAGVALSPAIEVQLEDRIKSSIRANSRDEFGGRACRSRP